MCGYTYTNLNSSIVIRFLVFYYSTCDVICIYYSILDMELKSCQILQ